jgi:diguanylate cyclase
VPEGDISRRGTWRLVRWTGLGTFSCLVVAVVYNILAFRHLGADALRVGITSAIVLPVILAGPLFFYLTLKLRELAIANHKLRHIASTDSLTGCLNRREFMRRVEAFLDRAGGSAGALLVIDADRFKSINDRFGHEAGDEALRLIASALRRTAGPDDVLGRLGGEEFALFIPLAGDECALRGGERARRAVEAIAFRHDDEDVALSVSIGCAVAEPGSSFAALFREADASLYRAKAGGRNRVWISDAPAVDGRTQDLALEDASALH